MGSRGREMVFGKVRAALMFAVALTALTLLTAAPAWAQELSVEKTGSPRTVVAGEEITYTVVVTNTGTTIAPLTTLEDDLSELTSLISVETTEGTCVGAEGTDPEVTCEIGTLDPNESATVTITARARASGTAENEACANTDPPLPSPPADLEGVCDTATTRIVPRLDIDKIDDRDPVNVGGNILYTLRVTNEGGGTANDIVVIDELPIGDVRLVSVDSNFFTCDALDPPTGRIRCTGSGLAPGTTASIKITVDPDEAGTITNTATVSASGVRTDQDTETTRVVDGGGGGNGDGNGDGGNGGNGGGGNGDGGGATATTDNTTATTDGDGVLVVSADDDQYKADVIVATIPDKILPNTGGPPLLGLAILGLALIGAGSSVLRAAIRRDR